MEPQTTVFTPAFITAIFSGMSLIVAAVLGFALKIWRDHNKMIAKMNDKMLDITAKNSASNEKLSNSLYKVSDTVAENTRATQASTDTLSKLMLELIRK